jgi:hypothetical protein
MTVIAGLVVATILVIMMVFRQEVTRAMTSLGRCVAGAASGSLAACGGGGAPQQAASAKPNAVPGMRNNGIASGLVMATPGGAAGGRGAAGDAARGAVAGAVPDGVRGTMAGTGGAAGGARGAAGGGPGGVGGAPPPGGLMLAANIPSGRDKIPPELRNQMQDRFGRLIRIAASGNQGVESNWETGARLWNRVTGGGAMENAMNNSEALGDRAWNRGLQSMRDARQRFDAGDVDGYNASIRDAQRWFGAASRNYAASNSTMADMAGQAADEAKFIADTSRQVNTAIAAAANPVGFATGMVVGTGVQTLAEATLPPGVGRDLAVGVTTAALTVYAGGAMGNPQLLGTRVLDQTTQMQIGLVNMATNAAHTTVDKGLEAGLQEVMVAAIVDVTMRAPVLPGSSPRDSRRSINDALSVMGEQRGNAIRDWMKGPEASAAVNHAAGDAAGELSKPGNLDAIDQARQGQSHTTKQDGAPPRELPPPSDDFRTKLEQTPRTPLSPESEAAARAAGINPELGADLVRIAAADGNEIILRPNKNTTASDAIQNGTGYGKSTDIHANTSETHGAVPSSQWNSKNGTAFRAASEELRLARASGDTARFDRATANMETARNNLLAAQLDIQRALNSGSYRAEFRPEVNDRVMIHNGTNRIVYGDHDGYASTASRPGDPLHNYGTYGQGSEAAAQSLANQRWALGNRDSARQHFDQSTAPSGTKLPPMGEVHAVVTKDGVKLIEGKGNLIDYMRSRGMREPPGANIEAGRAFRGQESQRSAAIAAGNAAAHNLNEQERQKEDRRPPATVAGKQAFVEGTRLQGQKQYAADARNAAAAQAANKADPAASARRQQVDAGTPKDKAQTAVAQQKVMGAVAKQRTVENKALVSPTPQNAAALDKANQDLRDVLLNQTGDRGVADSAVSSTFGTPSAMTLPGTSSTATGVSWNRGPEGPSLVSRLTDWVIAQRSTTAHGPVLALWLAPLDAARQAAAAPAGRMVSQSMVHERVHGHASAAWRSEFERLTALHEGVSQYFTEIAFDRVAGRQTAAFPAFAVQTDIAARVARFVGPKTLERAYFHGDTIALHAAMGRVMGAASPQEAVYWGRTCFGRVGQAMNEGLNAQVLQLLASYAATPAGRAAPPSGSAQAPGPR